MTAITISYYFLRFPTSQTAVSNTVGWVLFSIIWLVPLLYAARWRLWIFFRRLALPYVLFLVVLPWVLSAPSIPGLAALAVVLVQEGLALRYFAQNIPRSLALARSPAPETGTQSAHTTTLPGGEPPAGPATTPRNGLRRWLTWGVIATALLCIATSVVGGALQVGRDFASDAPELYWAVNLQYAATYLGAVAIIGAFLALVLDVAKTRLARRSSPWGDATSVRSDGYTTSMQFVRVMLFALPILAFQVAQPIFFHHAASDATEYAVNETLGSTTFALSALLSLIPLGRRARAG
jgi:hypothetical protein